MRLLLTLAALLVGYVGGPAPAVRADAPPRTAPATTTYLLDGVIRRAHGHDIRVPLDRAERRYATLLGHSVKGWVVVTGEHRVIVDDHGRVVSRQSDGEVNLYSGEQLSDDGRDVIKWSSGQDEIRDGTIQSLVTGRVRPLQVDEGYDLAMYHGVLWAATYRDGLKVLQGGHWRTTSKRLVTLVDPADRLAFTGTGDYRSGPTSLADVQAPTWQQSAVPEAVSPDGSMVVEGTDAGTYVVRRVSDGSVVRHLPVHQGGSETDLAVHDVAWTDDGTVGVVVTSDPTDVDDATRAVFACSVAAAHPCHRVSPWTRDFLSVPRYVQP